MAGPNAVPKISPKPARPPCLVLPLKRPAANFNKNTLCGFVAVFLGSKLANVMPCLLSYFPLSISASPDRFSVSPTFVPLIFVSTASSTSLIVFTVFSNLGWLGSLLLFGNFE